MEINHEYKTNEHCDIDEGSSMGEIEVELKREGVDFNDIIKMCITEDELKTLFHRIEGHEGVKAETGKRVEKENELVEECDCTKIDKSVSLSDVSGIKRLPTSDSCNAFEKDTTHSLHYHSYNDNFSVLENIKLARNSLHENYKNGYRHSSMWHLNALDEQSEDAVAGVLETCKKRGMFYFLNGAIDFDKESRLWSMGNADEPPSSLRADVNLVDKIKVYTISQYTVNVSRQYAMTGIEGTQDRSTKHHNNAPDTFLQEVGKCNHPVGTMVRYKRTDTTNVPHGHGVLYDPNLNRINVNMPRGFHDFVVLMMTIRAHHIFLNPHALVCTVLDPMCENNNSLTTDSVINAVGNSFTFKANAVAGTTQFNLTNKTTFGTHKVIEICDDNNFEESLLTYHKIKSFDYFCKDEEEMWKRCLKPLNGIEIQVHEHSMNCSAISGSKLLPVICRKGAQLLDERNENRIQVSLALSNSKGYLEKITRSLIWSSLSSFANIMCWRLNTHEMSKEKENETFNKICRPILEKLMASRENYAQATAFCQHLIQSTKMFTEPEMKTISHKFKVPEITALFEKK